MRITKPRIEKALKILKRADRATWVKLKCAKCGRELKQVLAFFLRRKFWCAHCEGRFDPRPLEALFSSGAIPKQSKQPLAATRPSTSSDDSLIVRLTKPDLPIRVIVVTEEDGRTVEREAIIAGREPPGVRTDRPFEPEETGRVELPAQKRRFRK